MRAPVVIWAAPLVLAAALAARTPDERQAMVDLAYVLGEAHALRQACQGSDDQSWRDRMSAMMSVEAPDPELKRRMVEAFNSGFAARRAGAPDCGPEVAEAERATAERGRALARRLGGGQP
jgi:uncharacterized protein (TIGR02301 family)